MQEVVKAVLLSKTEQSSSNKISPGGDDYNLEALWSKAFRYLFGHCIALCLVCD